jgi:tRNA pseudouridine38-40 synthase
MEKDQADNPACQTPVRLAFRVSYLGSRFYGSQLQETERTVEGEFIAACQRLKLFSDWRKAGLLSAGRTDRGVHACGQIVAFTTEVPDRAIESLNRQLPPDCWCTGYSLVPGQFHPRFDAVSRTYRYYFPGDLPDPADRERMDRAARSFIGSHNFTNFARVQGKNPYRNILGIQITEEDGSLLLEVKAESFLWHQVRCMASALARIGTHEAPEDSIRQLLESAAERPIPPAPAEGLVLLETDCGIAWRPLTPGDRSGGYVDHLIAHHALMGRVCRVLKEGIKEDASNFP